MIELALRRRRAHASTSASCFFGREELPSAESALTPLLEREPGLRDADLVVVMEPTDNALHAGCLGNINATWTFHGAAGHSRAAVAGRQRDPPRRRAAIAALAASSPSSARRSTGLTFREVVSVDADRTAGSPRNVIPDRVRRAASTTATRPGRAPREAEARLRALCEPHGELEIDSQRAVGRRCRDGNPLVAAPASPPATSTVAPKQAWTPVAEFAAAGVDAVNFGPGDPR